MATEHKDNYSQEIILHMTFLRCTRVTNDLVFLFIAYVAYAK